MCQKNVHTTPAAAPAKYSSIFLRTIDGFQNGHGFPFIDWNYKHIFLANSMFGTPKQKYNSEKSTGMSYRHNMHVISIIERFYVL